MAPPANESLSLSEYSIVRLPQSELDLEHTLASGQAFRWRRDQEGWWSGVVSHDGTILRCSQKHDQILYQTFPISGQENVLRSYFQLDVDLPSIAAKWEQSAGDEIQNAMTQFSGLRVTLQDPVECLISFLCSSVAPIYRIRRGIDSMCRTLTVPIAEIGGHTYYEFPTLDVLAATSRESYDKMGFGFRGGNIREAARILIEMGGRDYLVSLRDASYSDAKTALMHLPGVGAKIADCVCLFSLGKNDAVPLDVHVNRIARRLFPQAAKYKSLTDKSYNAIAGMFREHFSPYAGWAQQYLFYNELLLTGAWDKEMGVHVPGRKKS